MLDLILFLGGCSSDCKGSDIGWAALLLDVLDFFSLTVTEGVEFCSLLVLSDASEGGFTSEWVDNVDTAGGGENHHLSLRNAWGDVGGLWVGYLVHLPKVPQIFLVKEAQVEKDHYP